MLWGLFIYMLFILQERKNFEVAVTVNLHALIFHSMFLIHTNLSFFITSLWFLKHFPLHRFLA